MPMLNFNVIIPDIALQNGTQHYLKISVLKPRNLSFKYLGLTAGQDGKLNSPPKQELDVEAVPNLSTIKKGSYFVFHGLI